MKVSRFAAAFALAAVVGICVIASTPAEAVAIDLAHSLTRDLSLAMAGIIPMTNYRARGLFGAPRADVSDANKILADLQTAVSAFQTEMKAEVSALISV